MSAPNEIAELWPAVEQAAPNEPVPLLVCADRCAELHAHDSGTRPDSVRWDRLEFALRWCAGRGRRPHRTKLVRRPWAWTRSQAWYSGVSNAEVRRREPSVIPASVFDRSIVEGWERRFRSSYFAYTALCNWLAIVRSDLSAPTLTLPPPPEVVRARGKVECPVCRSTEVAS